MQWSRSETIAISKTSCTLCQGDGLRRTTRSGEAHPCNCVLRSIFRACFSRFRYCASKEKYMSRITLEYSSGKDQKRSYARRDEDYMADFCLVSKRSLDDFEYKIFRYHFLLGADWKLCCRQLKIDRGTFFHAVYRIQQRLGRVFRELEPFSLYPLNEYFGGVIQKSLPEGWSMVSAQPARSKSTLHPPLRRIA